MSEILHFSDDAENQEGEKIGAYDEAVEETLAKYANKTLFEQRIMREVVIGERFTKERMSNQTNWLGNSLTKDEIERRFESDFDFGMNCGGFALEVNACIFSSSNNVKDATDNILKTFPFVRIDDGSELGKKEYRAIYRHVEGGYGHHFIKEEGGRVLEKNECYPVQEFEGWPEQLKDAPEVVFIVSREHEIEPHDENGRVICSYMI